MADPAENNVVTLPQSVGYKRPPAHSRFKPGQSGNPSGRAKGSQNFKTLFHKILKEQVSLREGSDLRKVTKAEAIMRSLVVGALKGDTRSLGTLFRLAEQTGEFEDKGNPVSSITRIVVGWKDTHRNDGSLIVDASVAGEIPAISEACRDDDQ
jgi:uncharacterized protein DUF5681